MSGKPKAELIPNRLVWIEGLAALGEDGLPLTAEAADAVPVLGVRVYDVHVGVGLRVIQFGVPRCVSHVIEGHASYVARLDRAQARKLGEALIALSQPPVDTRGCARHPQICVDPREEHCYVVGCQVCAEARRLGGG